MFAMLGFILFTIAVIAFAKWFVHWHMKRKFHHFTEIRKEEIVQISQSVVAGRHLHDVIFTHV